MSPRDRAKAIVEHFPAIPQPIRPQLEQVITCAINRALAQQLAHLEHCSGVEARLSEGRGKHLKGRNPYAIEFHRHYEARFKAMREQMGL